MFVILCFLLLLVVMLVVMCLLWFAVVFRVVFEACFAVEGGCGVFVTCLSGVVFVWFVCESPLCLLH